MILEIKLELHTRRCSCKRWFGTENPSVWQCSVCLQDVIDDRNAEIKKLERQMRAYKGAAKRRRLLYGRGK